MEFKGKGVFRVRLRCVRPRAQHRLWRLYHAMLPCGSRASRLAQGCISSAVDSGEPRLASRLAPCNVACWQCSQWHSAGTCPHTQGFCEARRPRALTAAAARRAQDRLQNFFNNHKPKSFRRARAPRGASGAAAGSGSDGGAAAAPPAGGAAPAQSPGDDHAAGDDAAPAMNGGGGRAAAADAPSAAGGA